MTKSARQCPVCENKNTYYFAEKNKYTLSKCSYCDLVFIDPELPDDFLLPLYNKQGAPRQGLRYPYDKGMQRQRRAAVRAKRLSSYFKGKNAIDIGCGGGYMVDAMQRMGGLALGIDLDPEAIMFARKHHHPEAVFYCESIEDFVNRGLKFGFGHSSQVIEHVGNLNEFIAAWAILIESGGLFFLKTPDRKHWWAGKEVHTWPNPPHYIQYFSKKNIRILLEKHGFEILKIFFNFKPTMEIIARRK